MRGKFTTLLIMLLMAATGYAQVSLSLQRKYPELVGYETAKFVQFTIQSGFTDPINPYNAKNNYPTGNMGFDISYRVNREVALYSEIKYNFLSSKDTAFPKAGYIESTVGARYYVRPACIRSSFFFEAGFGPFVYVQGSSDSRETQIDRITHDPHGSKMQSMKTTLVVQEPAVYESETKVRFGTNIGVGGELVITNSLFLTLKVKLNTAFEPNGNTSYIAGLGGLTVRL